MANILSVAQSALNAAQVGVSTTGHNIANASTPGYSRQIVVQGSAGSQDLGFGFIGKGTEISAITRVYSNFLGEQVRNSQSSLSHLSAYHSQAQQINNLFADSSVGLSPALQEFFKGVQNLASDPGSVAARQSMLTSASTLASQFQSASGRLSEMQQSVNSQITSSIASINSYAQQIATLNNAIGAAMAGNAGKPANDLLDQRDQLIADLAQEVKVSVVRQGEDYSIFIGNGQPLVVGANAYKMVTTTSPTDQMRIQVGYVSNGNVINMAESSLTGGKLGGLLEFRSNTLDAAQNSLGRLAVGLATAFNTQHQLGQDRNGALGGAFFNVGAPLAVANTNNNGTMQMGAVISNPDALTTSDYQVQYVGPGNYRVTRLSDGAITTSGTLPLTVDGVDFQVTSGTPAAGDIFLVRPTAAAATGFNVAITDPAKIAAAAPIRSAAGSANSGTGAIGSMSIASTTALSPISLTYDSTGPTLSGFPAGMPVTVDSGGTVTTYPAGAPVPYLAGDIVSFGGVTVRDIPDVDGSYNVGPPTSTLTYDSSTGTLSGFPDYMDVTVTQNGTSTTYAAGTPVPFTEGATLSYGGISFALSGAPANGDTFTVAANINGIGDNRNALLLAGIQTANVLGNGSSTIQSAFGQMVNSIANKTRELGVMSSAEGRLLTESINLQQSNSGVNLDEEATNLLRYQQAYQAAGKMMQVANKMFDVLISLGN